MAAPPAGREKSPSVARIGRLTIAAPRVWLEALLGTPFIRRMVVLGGALLLIVILGLLPERSFNRARDAEQLVTHTLRVINASGALLSIIEDAETGERGYLLTGEDRYLQPYQSALSSYRQATRNLRQLTVTDSVQQARIDRLDRMVETKLEGRAHV